MSKRILMDELIRLTGKKPRALQTMAKAGRIPSAAKIGGQWTFDRSRVKAWIVFAEDETCGPMTMSKNTSSKGTAGNTSGTNAAGRTLREAYAEGLRRLQERGRGK